MTSYGYSEDGIRALRRRVRRIFLVAALLGLPLGAWGIAAMLRYTGHLDSFWWMLVAVPLLVTVFTLFASRQALAQATRLWQGFRIELGDGYIAGHGPSGGKWRLSAESLTHVLETRGSMVLSTAEGRASGAVPAEIGPRAYQEVRRVLSEWAPIETESHRVRQTRIALRILQLAGFAVVILSPWHWLVVAAFVLQAAGYITLQFSRKIEPFARRGGPQYVVYSAVIAALRLSPWSHCWEAFLSALYFK
jgi:hypothetical protein